MATHDVASPAWAEVMNQLTAGTAPRGGWVVTGKSSSIGKAVQQILGISTSLPLHVEYLACCSSDLYAVPCYEFPDIHHARTVGPSDVLDAVRAGRHHERRTVLRLLRQAANTRSRSSLFVIECITPASRAEQKFLRLLFLEGLSARCAILVFAHSIEYERSIGEIDSANAKNLVILYISGGRLRIDEWEVLAGAGVIVEDDQTTRYVARRTTRSVEWVTYGSRHLASLSAHHHAIMERGERAELEAAVLRELPISRMYPILAIAAGAADNKLRLSSYTPDLLVGIPAQSRGVREYFRSLRREATTIECPDLKRSADANYAALLLYSRERNARWLRRVISRTAGAEGGAGSGARLWMEVGQRLAKSRDEECLNLALECFAAGRQSLVRAPEADAPRARSQLAALANAEALVAFRRKDAARAEGLVVSALSLIEGIKGSREVLGQQALLEVHLGDVALRIHRDRSAALEHYRRAHELSQQAEQEVRDYVDPKYGATLLGAGKCEDAVAVLNSYLTQTARAENRGDLPDPKALLAAKLSLAQALYEIGHSRSAAACYWGLLRRPGVLKMRALRAIAANLSECFLAFDQTGKARVQRLLATHQAAIDAADIACTAVGGE